MKALIFAALSVFALVTAVPAIAQMPGADDPAPGYSSLMSADYASAVRDIRNANVSPDDPARSINLGIALAKSGHAADAAVQFRSVLLVPEKQFVVANGETVSSYDVARRALSSLRDGELAR